MPPVILESIVTDEQKSLLREIRLWHWKEVLRNRKHQYRLEKQVLANAAAMSRGLMHKRSADFHASIVQKLDVFFDKGDYAYIDLENKIAAELQSRVKGVDDGKPTP